MYIIVMYGIEVARCKKRDKAENVYWEYANIHGGQEVEMLYLTNGGGVKRVY